MNLTKTTLTVFAFSMLVVTALTGCKKEDDTTNADWATPVIGSYTGQDNEGRAITVQVYRVGDKSIKLVYSRPAGLSWGKVNFTADNAAMSSASNASFTSGPNCEMQDWGGLTVNYCESFRGTAVFSGNSLNLAFTDSSTADGNYFTDASYTAAASK